MHTQHTEPESDARPDAKPGGTPPAPRRRTLRLVVLATLTAVMIAGLVTAGPTLWRVAQQRGTEIVLPQTIGVLVRDDSTAAAETADYLISALYAGVELRDSAGAVYLDPEAGPASSVILAVGTATLYAPEDALDEVLTLLASGTSAPEVWRDSPAGRASVIKCGISSESDTGTDTVALAPDEAPSTDAIALCGWADHGSIALALLPGRDAPTAVALLTELHATVLR